MEFVSYQIIHRIRLLINRFFNLVCSSLVNFFSLRYYIFWSFIGHEVNVSKCLFFSLQVMNNYPNQIDQLNSWLHCFGPWTFYWNFLIFSVEILSLMAWFHSIFVLDDTIMHKIFRERVNSMNEFKVTFVTQLSVTCGIIE